MSDHWKELCELALAEVESTLQSLPEPLRARARVLALTFEPTPNPEQLADGIEADTLGLFVGPDFAAEDAVPMPPQIILYLENLWDQAERDEELFLEEVHTTYLHELGHYLGLDEEELTQRGLE